MGRWAVCQSRPGSRQGGAPRRDRGAHGWTQGGLGRGKRPAQIEGVLGRGAARFADAGAEALALHDRRWPSGDLGSLSRATAKRRRAALLEPSDPQRAGCHPQETPDRGEHLVEGHAVCGGPRGVRTAAGPVQPPIPHAGFEGRRTLIRCGERLVTFYQFPKEHWRHLRTTNVVESPFAAVRLRTTAGKGTNAWIRPRP